MDAMKGLFFLYAVLLGVSLSQAAFLGHLKAKRNYNKINEHLTQTVASNDIDKNMEEAAKWLVELEAQQGQKSCLWMRSNSLLKDLKQFLELRTILSSNKCNNRGVEILEANDHAVGDLLDTRAEKKGPTRRIDTIIKHYASHFSDSCFEIYPKLVADKMASLSAKSKEYISRLTYGEPVDFGLLFKFVKSEPGYWDRVRDMKYVYEKKEVTKDDFYKYMVNPCLELEEKVNKDQYDVTQFLVIFRQRDESSVKDPKYNDLQNNFSAMSVCRGIIEKRSKIWNKMDYAMWTEKNEELRRLAWLDSHPERGSGGSVVVAAGAAAGGR